ncbi:MAG: lipopolysaccharide heptosyltransferase II, partial [bacterium]
MALTAAGEGERHLVIAPAWIGDSAMAAPFFASLRAALPRARIEALAGPWTAGLLGAFPWIDSVRVLEGGAGKGKWRAFLSVRRVAGPGAPEAIWLLPNSFRAAALARRIGARRRIGYARDGRGWLLTRPVAPPPDSPPPHLVDYYLGLLEAEGLEAAHRAVRLPVSPEAARFADRLLADEAPAGEGPLIGMHPGAFFGDSKLWPLESFAALAVRLAREEGARVLLLGGPDEIGLAGRVAEAAGGAAVNLAGRDTLATLPGLLARLRGLVSGDTGPLHAAALVGTPTVSLFGPTDPRRTAPRGP